MEVHPIKLFLAEIDDELLVAHRVNSHPDIGISALLQEQLPRYPHQPIVVEVFL